MKLSIRAAGSMKSGPERDLFDDYIKRAELLARRTGFLSVDEVTIETKNLKSKTEMTEAILKTSSGGILVVLDERGKGMTSREIAHSLARWRDDGMTNVTFAIGDADGFDKAEIPQEAVKWRFGSQTWPHKLVRVMLAEQVYRALSILAGTPYHRD